MRNDTNDAIFYIYGICEPDPGGFACLGMVAYWKGVKHYNMDAHLFASKYNTTEAATYNGILQTLHYLLRNKYNGVIEIRLTHQKVIGQILGHEEARSINARNLREEIKKLIPRFENVIFCWVPLAENKEAELVALGHFYKYRSIVETEGAENG